MKTYIVNTNKGRFMVTAFDKTQAVFKVRNAHDLHWSEVSYTENFNL